MFIDSPRTANGIATQLAFFQQETTRPSSVSSNSSSLGWPSPTKGPLLEIEHRENPTQVVQSRDCCTELSLASSGNKSVSCSSLAVDTQSHQFTSKALALPSNPKRSNKSFRCFTSAPIQLTKSSISRFSRATFRLSGLHLLDPE